MKKKTLSLLPLFFLLLSNSPAPLPVCETARYYGDFVINSVEKTDVSGYQGDTFKFNITNKGSYIIDDVFGYDPTFFIVTSEHVNPLSLRLAINEFIGPYETKTITLEEPTLEINPDSIVSAYCEAHFYPLSYDVTFDLSRTVYDKDVTRFYLNVDTDTPYHYITLTYNLDGEMKNNTYDSTSNTIILEVEGRRNFGELKDFSITVHEQRWQSRGNTGYYLVPLFVSLFLLLIANAFALIVTLIVKFSVKLHFRNKKNKNNKKKKNKKEESNEVVIETIKEE